jgi:phage terminase large subunit
MVTIALKKILKLTKKIRIVQGGQGAGKTFAILAILINEATNNPNREIFIASAELSKMRITIIKDFKKLMKSLNLFMQSEFVGGTLYRFKNGSFIQFLGLDKADVGKGLRSDILFVNEADKVDYETYREISSRAKVIYIDYNPTTEFWVDEYLTNDVRAAKIVLTYKDNQYLSMQEVEEIEGYKTKAFFNPNLEKYDFKENTKNFYWRNKWLIYGLGKHGFKESVIFKNITIIDRLPEKLYNKGIGLDFGYTNDPSAGVLCGKLDNGLFFDELFYRTKMLSRDIVSELRPHHLPVVADSADPRLITEIYNGDVNIKKVVKGSVENEVNEMSGYEIFVTKNSTNLIRELKNYKYLEDRAGKILNQPEDKNNHGIDAARYWFKTNVLAPPRVVYRAKLSF